jgi:hypothetical protein
MYANELRKANCAMDNLTTGEGELGLPVIFNPVCMYAHNEFE